ncbi:MAG: response regulator [Halobacteriales archaeon]
MAATDDPIRVLQVEDEPEFAELTADYLEREDERLVVDSAPDASAALDRLAADEVDCVVSDYDLAERTGIDLLEAVRASYPDLPVILFTGKGSEEVASDAISAGVTDYLQKGGADQFALLANRVVNAVEQRRARAAAARTERRLLELSENTNDVLWMFNHDWSELLFVNSAYETIWGRSADRLEADSRDFLNGIHPEDRDRVREAMSRLSAGEPVDLEYRVNAAEDYGRTVWVQGEPVVEAGEVVRVVGFARDVTDRRKREEQFRTLHAVAEDFEACETPGAVYERLVDGAETVLEYDLAIADAAEGDQLVPRAVASPVEEGGYYEETPTDADDNLAARAYRTGETSLVEDLRDGSVDPADDAYRAALTVPIGDHGVFQAVSTTVGEFSESDRELVETLVSHARTTLDRLDRERSLRERTAELERKNDRLEQFAGLVSHDLRNPLNVAQGELALAREAAESDHLDAAAEALDRMAALIDDVLALARDDGPVEAPAAVDLGAVAEDCWAGVASAAANLTVRTDAVIRADEARLRQLLENLFRNAVEHGGDDVAVTVGRLEDGFYVEDDGPGVPAGEREAVLEAGYSTRPEGTGFGLSIAERIADDHGWSLAVAAGADGGARLEVRDVAFD